MREEMGLATERRMRRPLTVALWWSGPSVVMATAWMVSAAMRTTTHPAADGSWPEVDSALEVAMVVAFIGIGLGCAHATIQYLRRDREQRRVRAADSQYLTARPADERDT
ncbi:hypothetical protein [Streptomyces sp. NPDC059788]|uniref:hypothetical protein n=1 Tax=Streptomyces sp. NPDC059788 TaxID=3346948 RepID=UPI00364DFD2B